MPTTERSSIEGPRLQRSPQTSRMGFASLVFPISMVWASSLVRTSNTADSSLLLPHNKSLDASGGGRFSNHLGAAGGGFLAAAAPTRCFRGISFSSRFVDRPGERRGGYE